MVYDIDNALSPKFGLGSAHRRRLAPWRALQPMSRQFLSVLAWPLWLRVACVLPVLLLLWMAVTWAHGPVQP